MTPAEPLPTSRDLPGWRWEHHVRSLHGWIRVAGVDEAGRGALAGPVVAAAVLLGRSVELDGLDDSKRLLPERREELAVRILDAAEGWGIGLADESEIDRLNILRATHLAMRRALESLRPACCGALVDGLPVPGLPIPHLAVVGGDRQSRSIAAASILAKVTRDRLLRELDERYPGYGLAAHKGYGTGAHLAALRVHGPAPCHRRSFAPVRALDPNVAQRILELG